MDIIFSPKDNLFFPSQHVALKFQIIKPSSEKLHFLPLIINRFASFSIEFILFANHYKLLYWQCLCPTAHGDIKMHKDMHKLQIHSGKIFICILSQYNSDEQTEREIKNKYSRKAEPGWMNYMK